MEFAAELDRVLCSDLPNRERVIEKAAEHLALILAANAHFNLTRITNANEAAIKHIFDSIAPWRHFAKARRVLDAGTGAGFPGVPLALVLPDVSFTLTDSTHKKARFVESAVEALGIHNADVASERAEQLALAERPEIITARAVAPLDRLLDLFHKPIQKGTRLILYKGPEVENELAAAKKYKIKAQIIERYELPDGMGSRVILEITG